ncbi:MAG: response regulator transcription factor [Chitinophagaceae bacterium]|nr:MAG: response regulator transcription factor [Chitinophagaceae bacterium]
MMVTRCWLCLTARCCLKMYNPLLPHLVLMDVQLAQLDGRQLCRALKEQAQTAALPVILISAASGMQSCLLEKGAPDDFIAKPFDLDHLLTKVDFLLVA